MAKETKSLTVPPDAENDQISLWQTFGWELFSTQEVLSKDSHLEEGFFGNSINSVTETTHYIKLTFQRDPANVPHYAELKRLETEFNSVPSPGDPPTKFSILHIIIGLFLCTIPGVFMIIKNIASSSAMPKWQREYDQFIARRNEIYQQALALSES